MKKPTVAKHQTIGVRFFKGKFPNKIYTYKVLRRANIQRGDILVVEMEGDPRFVVVMRVDPTVVLPKAMYEGQAHGLKEITQRVAPL